MVCRDSCWPVFIKSKIQFLLACTAAPPSQAGKTYAAKSTSPILFRKCEKKDVKHYKTGNGKNHENLTCFFKTRWETKKHRKKPHSSTTTTGEILTNRCLLHSCSICLSHIRIQSCLPWSDPDGTKEGRNDPLKSPGTHGFFKGNESSSKQQFLGNISKLVFKKGWVIKKKTLEHDDAFKSKLHFRFTIIYCTKRPNCFPIELLTSLFLRWSSVPTEGPGWSGMS